MAFVNNEDGEHAEDTASTGQPIDFDPNDSSIVKVHYDLAAWTFDQRAEVAEALAEAELPHYWDDDELVVPEAAEAAADELFERLESQFGPFPVALGVDEPSVEYGLDEWSDAERATLTAQLIEAEIPHRWEDATVVVAADAEEDVDAVLDEIESGTLAVLDDGGTNDPPEGVLSDLFLAADTLAREPIDARARRTLIELNDQIDAKHLPYALPPRVWKQAVAATAAIVELIDADAVRPGLDSSDDEVSDAAGELRSVVRDYV